MRKPKTVLAAAPVKPETAERVPYVNKTVDRIASAIADMLTYGGEPDDLERIILAAISHQYRTYSLASRDRDELKRRVRDEQASCLPRMLKELADVRIERTDFSEDDAVETAAIIRQSSRRQCASEFEDFLHDADPEEVRFLYNVLNFRFGNGSHKHELAIATAFFNEIDSNIEVFRVPEKHSAAVDAYITALMKAPPTEDAS